MLRRRSGIPATFLFWLGAAEAQRAEFLIFAVEQHKHAIGEEQSRAQERARLKSLKLTHQHHSSAHSVAPDRERGCENQRAGSGVRGVRVSPECRSQPTESEEGQRVRAPSGGKMDA